MSIHSEIPVNSPEEKFLGRLCDMRWEKMKNPCKQCKYRYPIEDSTRCCIFPTLPRDWCYFK